MDSILGNEFEIFSELFKFLHVSLESDYESLRKTLEEYKINNPEQYSRLLSATSTLIQDFEGFQKERMKRLDIQPFLFLINKCPKCESNQIYNLEQFSIEHPIESIEIYTKISTKIRMCSVCKSRW